MSDLIRREDAYAAIRGLTRHIDRIAAITALPAVQPDADELVGHMTKLIAAGLDRIEQLTAERDGLLRCVTDNHVALCRAEAAEAERDRLRDALDGLLASVEHANFEEGWCCCGDDMLHHQNPMDCGHTPVDMGEYHASLAIKEARAALKGDSHE